LIAYSINGCQQEDVEGGRGGGTVESHMTQMID